MTILGTLVFIFSVQEKFDTAEYHKFRGIMFLAFGISAGTPIIQLGITEVKGNSIPFDFTLWYIGGIAYIIGGVLYTMRIPERFWPGKFCIIGNSHQIFHCFVLIGVFSHYFACMDCYFYRTTYQCPA